MARSRSLTERSTAPGQLLGAHLERALPGDPGAGRHDVREHPLEPHRIGRDLGQVRRQLDVDARGIDHPGEVAEDLHDEAAEHQPLARELDRPRLQPGRVHELVEQPLDEPRRARDRLRAPALLAELVAREPVREELRPQPDERQRRADVVRDGAQQVLALLVELVDGRDVPKGDHRGAGGAREPQHLFGAALDVRDDREGAPALAVRLGEADAVVQLVADERQGAAEEHRDEQLVAVASRLDRLVVAVDDLGDDLVPEEVQARVPVALGRDGPGLGRDVLVERLPAPGGGDAMARLVREHLRGGEDGPGRDVQAAGDLLGGQPVRDGRVRRELVGQEGLERGREPLEGLVGADDEHGGEDAPEAVARPARLVQQYGRVHRGAVGS
jgi:hypothetical protein